MTKTKARQYFIDKDAYDNTVEELLDNIDENFRMTEETMSRLSLISPKIKDIMNHWREHYKLHPICR